MDGTPKGHITRSQVDENTDWGSVFIRVKGEVLRVSRVHSLFANLKHKSRN